MCAAKPLKCAQQITSACAEETCLATATQYIRIAARTSRITNASTISQGPLCLQKKIKNKLNKIRNNKISVISLIYQNNQIGGQRYLNIKEYEYYYNYNKHI